MESPVSLNLEGSKWANTLNAYREYEWKGTEPM